MELYVWFDLVWFGLLSDTKLFGWLEVLRAVEFECRRR